MLPAKVETSRKVASIPISSSHSPGSSPVTQAQASTIGPKNTSGHSTQSSRRSGSPKKHGTSSTHST